jgi:hypothetical protein
MSNPVWHSKSNLCEHQDPSQPVGLPKDRQDANSTHFWGRSCSGFRHRPESHYNCPRTDRRTVCGQFVLGRSVRTVFPTPRGRRLSLLISTIICHLVTRITVECPTTFFSIHAYPTHDLSMLHCTNFCTNRERNPETLRYNSNMTPGTGRYGDTLRDGVASSLHAGGRGFKSLTAHHI